MSVCFCVFGKVGQVLVCMGVWVCVEQAVCFLKKNVILRQNVRRPVMVPILKQNSDL